MDHDNYAKGWEAGVLWARHVLRNENDIAKALDLIDKELDRAATMRKLRQRDK